MDIERLLLRLKEVVGEDDGRPAERSGVQLPRSSTNQGERSLQRRASMRCAKSRNSPGHASEGLDPSTITTDFLSRACCPWCLSSFEWQEVRHEDHDFR